MTAAGETEPPQYRQELTAHPEAVAGARRIVSAHVRLWGHGQLAEAAALCVSELLSNVGKHTASPACVLTLQRCPGGVRVIVSDTSSVLPVPKEPDWCAEGGRGLIVLQSVADTWGRRTDGRGQGRMGRDPYGGPRTGAGPSGGAGMTEALRPVCGERACLRGEALRLAEEFVPRSATAPEDVEIHLRCTLETHVTGDHHAFVRELDGLDTASLWTHWTRGHDPAKVVVRPDCEAVSPDTAREPCCEFARHPGAHTWQLHDPWRRSP